MAEPSFDPSHSVQFDLARGRVALDATDARLLVPPLALLDLCQSAGQDAIRAFGRQIGVEVGRRVAQRLGSGLDRLGVASFIEHLGGDLALIGLGSLAAERWGRALILMMSDSPLGQEGDALLAAVLEGAIERALVRQANVLALQREAGQTRFLVVSVEAAAKVRGWLAGGQSWGEVLARLNGSGRGEA
ncbi:MAG TPA: hypothetical protein VK524_25195 [Polyangiaceae bacterium]|nr:hypothetical protein [Polyangiaceae bacterium]